MWTMNENLVPHMYDNVRTDSMREAQRLGLLGRDPEPRSTNIHFRKAISARAARLGRFLISLGKRLERLDPAASSI